MIHLARLAIATVALIFAGGPATAQTSQTSGGPVDPALIEDLVAANRILAEEGVLDACETALSANPSRRPLATSEWR
jgi:hypothetical protein